MSMCRWLRATVFGDGEAFGAIDWTCLDWGYAGCYKQYVFRKKVLVRSLSVYVSLCSSFVCSSKGTIQYKNNRIQIVGCYSLVRVLPLPSLLTAPHTVYCMYSMQGMKPSIGQGIGRGIYLFLARSVILFCYITIPTSAGFRESRNT